MATATRDIEPGEAQDLLRRVPRACIAFADADGPVVEPCEVLAGDEQHLVGLGEGARLPGDGDEIVLLVDEGLQYFELRAIYLRGTVAVADRPAAAPPGTWFALRPTKVVAWDYGRMRMEHDQ